MSEHPTEAEAPAAIRDLPYRPGVGIMLLDSRGRVFVAQRIDMPSAAWQMPQGGIDKGESPLEAARRELAEETGTDKAELIGESRDWYFYDLPADLVPKLWRWCPSYGAAGSADRPRNGLSFGSWGVTRISTSPPRNRNFPLGNGRISPNCPH
jgi:8-oxo-dGTP pyrophosphatase MutT (NUDIX family)